ncbi:hypothetical protein D049_1418A, partial [Vibrio parahaemolyticus VPTS-2010]
MLIQLGDLLL